MNATAFFPERNPLDALAAGLSVQPAHAIPADRQGDNLAGTVFAAGCVSLSTKGAEGLAIGGRQFCCEDARVLSAFPCPDFDSAMFDLVHDEFSNVSRLRNAEMEVVKEGGCATDARRRVPFNRGCGS
jgi:hypothetical protein